MQCRFLIAMCLSAWTTLSLPACLLHALRSLWPPQHHTAFANTAVFFEKQYTAHKESPRKNTETAGSKILNAVNVIVKMSEHSEKKFVSRAVSTWLQCDIIEDLVVGGIDKHRIKV